MPLIFSLLLWLLGFVSIKRVLDGWTRFWAPVKWAISLGLPVCLILAQYLYANYHSWPRQLRPWQRDAFVANCPRLKKTAGRITFYVGSAPGQLEAADYSQQLMRAFNACGLDAGYGYDPAPTNIVVNADKVVVPPDTNFLLSVSGIQLWVLDPQVPPEPANS
jgi:hypothetical protein